MTRGKTPAWSDGPIAQWIKEHLDERGKNKDWLAGEIASRTEIKKESALAAVIRWTAKDVTPDTESRRLLFEIFGEPPPAASHDRFDEVLAAISAVQEEVQSLAEEIHALASSSQPESDPPAIPEARTGP